MVTRGSRKTLGCLPAPPPSKKLEKPNMRVFGPGPLWALGAVPTPWGHQACEFFEVKYVVCVGRRNRQLSLPPLAKGTHWPWPQGPKVCERGREPKGTPKPTFLPPNGSPWHHLGLGDRDPAQNCGADLARGVPPPQSQLFFDPFWIPKMGKCQFL